jgi:peptide/nickel transport system ATP-binding protein
MPSMLEVQNVTTRYVTRAGAVQAVNDVSFAVPQGEIVGIVGESGCGKSATIRSILGLIRPPGVVVGGKAILNGRDLLAMSRKQLQAVRGSDVGFVAQNPFGALNPILKIHKQFDNVIRTHRKGIKRSESRRLALGMLEQVGIPGPERVLDGYAHELSGGMAQRVVIAMALALDPGLVVADEPTTALDVTIQRQILDLMRDLVLQENRSMLLVTHDLGVVSQYCDRVVVMYAGKVVETGTVHEVFAAPAHPYTLALLESVPRRGEVIRALTGRVPDLINYPDGCPYRFRCRFAHDRCAEVAPVPEPLSGLPHRTASCHLPPQEVISSVPRAS